DAAGNEGEPRLQRLVVSAIVTGNVVDPVVPVMGANDDVVDVRLDSEVTGASLVAATSAEARSVLHVPNVDDSFSTGAWVHVPGVAPAIDAVADLSCGNGIVEPGEACDPGSATPAGCADDCTVVDDYVCGGRGSLCVLATGVEVVRSAASLLAALGNGDHPFLLYAPPNDASGNLCASITSEKVVVGTGRADAVVGCSAQPAFTVHAGGTLHLGGLTVAMNSDAANTQPALLVLTGRRLTISDAVVRGSKATGIATESDSELVISGSFIRNNSGRALQLAGSAQIDNSLIAVNGTGTGNAVVLDVLAGSGEVRLRQSSLLRNSSAALWQCAAPRVVGTSLVQPAALPASCGTSSGITSIIALDIVPDDDDLHLGASSSAIDACPADGLAWDYDYEPRVAGSRYDCGADEVRAPFSP
ncbi:MAG TPA: hypothetical protein VGF99_05905, partial [Myxococcota bacterium]